MTHRNSKDDYTILFFHFFFKDLLIEEPQEPQRKFFITNNYLQISMDLYVPSTLWSMWVWIFYFHYSHDPRWPGVALTMSMKYIKSLKSILLIDHILPNKILFFRMILFHIDHPQELQRMLHYFVVDISSKAVCK